MITEVALTGLLQKENGRRWRARGVLALLWTGVAVRPVLQVRSKWRWIVEKEDRGM